MKDKVIPVAGDRWESDDIIEVPAGERIILVWDNGLKTVLGNGKDDFSFGKPGLPVVLFRPEYL